MKCIYTIFTKLTTIRNDGSEELLDILSSDFAYRTRENAYKAVLRLKKDYINNLDYEATRSDFEVVKNVNGNKYNVNFVIKEYYLSDYEKVD